MTIPVRMRLANEESAEVRISSNSRPSCFIVIEIAMIAFVALIRRFLSWTAADLIADERDTRHQIEKRDTVREGAKVCW